VSVSSVAIKPGVVDRRVLVALALVGPLIAGAVASAASRRVEEQRKSAAVARDLTTLFGAAYGVLQGAESAQRALSSALATRDAGVRFVPQYQAAAAGMRDDLGTVARLVGLAPECTAAVRDVSRPYADAIFAADRVVGALRRHDRDRAVVAGYEFQAAISLTRDAAQALVEAVHAVVPRRLGTLAGAAEEPPPATAPLWAGGLGAAVVALVLWGAMSRPRLPEPRAHAPLP
jgi:hypothetical protein